MATSTALRVYRTTNAPQIPIPFVDSAGDDIDLTGSVVTMELWSAVSKAHLLTLTTEGPDLAITAPNEVIWSYDATMLEGLPLGRLTYADFYREIGGAREKIGTRYIDVGGVGQFGDGDTGVIVVPGIQGPPGDVNPEMYELRDATVAARDVAEEYAEQTGANATAVETARGEVASNAAQVAIQTGEVATNTAAVASNTATTVAATAVAVEAAAAATETALSGGITVADLTALNALTSIPGTDPAQPLRALMPALVIAEGAIYRRNAGNTAWDYDSPSTKALGVNVAGLNGLIQRGISGDILRIVDELGFAGARITAGGGLMTAVLSLIGSLGIDASGQLTTSQFRIETSSDGFVVKDANGFHLFAVRPGKPTIFESIRTLDGFDSSKGFSGFQAGEIVARDSAAVGLTALRNSLAGSAFQRPTAKWNIILVYGQSLANAKEAVPDLTRVPPLPGVYMLGDAVRTLPDSAGWTTIGTPGLTPARSRTQNNSTGAIIADDAVPGLSYPSPYNGEDVGVAGAYVFRKLWMDHELLTIDPERQIIVINCSVGGQTLANLSPGASPEYFNRVREGFAAVQAAVGADQVRLIGTLFLQGEADASSGVATTTDAYKTGAIALKAAIDAQAAIAFGQTEPAAFITYQTGGEWAASNMRVADAQRQLVTEQRNWHIAAPSYHVTNCPDGHLNGNGSRWLACYFGKALFETLVLGRWKRGLLPIEAVARGNTILLTFDVPTPPLQFKDFFALNDPVTVLNKGLYISADANGGVEIPITAVEVAGRATIKITTSGSVSAGSYLWLGRVAAFGGTNICDSDPTLPIFNYEYDAAKGGMATENIASLVGKPYPLNNFAVVGKLPITLV